MLTEEIKTELSDFLSMSEEETFDKFIAKQAPEFAGSPLVETMKSSRYIQQYVMSEWEEVSDTLRVEDFEDSTTAAKLIALFLQERQEVSAILGVIWSAPSVVPLATQGKLNESALGLTKLDYRHALSFVGLRNEKGGDAPSLHESRFASQLRQEGEHCLIAWLERSFGDELEQLKEQLSLSEEIVPSHSEARFDCVEAALERHPKFTRELDRLLGGQS